MSGLPPILRKAPAIFYALAVVFFAWRIGNEWATLSLSSVGMGGDSFQSFETLSKSNALFNATLDSVYLLGNGLWMHILICIHDNVAGPAK